MPRDRQHSGLCAFLGRVKPAWTFSRVSVYASMLQTSDATAADLSARDVLTALAHWEEVKTARDLDALVALENDKIRRFLLTAVCHSAAVILHVHVAEGDRSPLRDI